MARTREQWSVGFGVGGGARGRSSRPPVSSSNAHGHRFLAGAVGDLIRSPISLPARNFFCTLADHENRGYTLRDLRVCVVLAARYRVREGQASTRGVLPAVVRCAKYSGSCASWPSTWRRRPPRRPRRCAARLTTFALAALPGSPAPRIESIPPWITSASQETVELLDADRRGA